MAAATTAVAASDLASDLVQECLGFTSLPSKLASLRKIQASLQSCFCAGNNGNDNNSREVVGDAESISTQQSVEWREFLEGASEECANDGFDSADGNAVDFMLRDSLIKCLVESCHPSEENTTDNDDEKIIDIIESSLICLTYLIRLRCVEDKESKKRGASVAPIFGPDFVSTIATDVVEALKLDDGSTTDGVSHAASQLVIALLRSDRPRNEIAIPTVRDSILLPACAADSPVGSVSCIAQVLSSSIIGAVEYAVPPSATMDEEELSMRRETAALNCLQDMRDVMQNVGFACSRLLTEGSGAPNANSQRILGAIQEIYDIAAFAVESQLETLLDEKAAPILSRLSKESTNQADKLNDNTNSMMDEDDDSDDGEEATLEEACTLAPIYANIAKPPAILSTTKGLESMLVAINESLITTDAELWDERLDALIDLERILAGGVASLSDDARYLFIEKVRKMPLGEQFTDLRSQITQQACRVIIATAYEYRAYVVEDGQLNQVVSHFFECCIPSILNLCKSGTRLMSTSGINCLLCLVSVCGSIGYPRTVPRFCDEILGKKVHKNRKRGSVVALTAALRVWDASCFVKHIDELTKAVKEGATNRDPAVREEGRKLYWAMHACSDETAAAVDKMFDGRSREMKNLKKERDGIDAEWEEGGIMCVLVETGVLGQAPDEPAKKPTKPKPRAPPAPKGAPPRNSVKRPAGARFRAQHGTPFKSQRVSTPQKSASAGVSSNMKRPPSSAGSRAQTSVTPTTAYSPMKFSESKSVNRRARPSPAPMKSEEVITSALPTGKENSTAVRTPAKSVGFSANPASPIVGTPVVNLLARASPLSAEKVKNTGDVLGEVISMLSDRLSPHEQSLGIKALALFAKENPNDPAWKEKFPLVLQCLLDRIINMPNDDFNGPVDFIRSPTKNLSSCDQMQHLFLQGVRSLLQFVPGYVKNEQVKDIVNCMLECTKDAPFEIVHTAEKALQNLVTSANPETCFEHLLPFTSVQIDMNDKSNPSALLSTLRTMRYLVDRISTDTLKKASPSLLPLCHTALGHKSVDMRKATVFIIVEMYFVLGDELDLDEFSDSQRRLIDVYVDRHPKKSQVFAQPITA